LFSMITANIKTTSECWMCLFDEGMKFKMNEKIPSLIERRDSQKIKKTQKSTSPQLYTFRYLYR
jgi:hypothetical protein